MRRRLDPTSPFDVLEASFQALSADPRPLVLDGADVPGLPDRRISLEELRSRLLHPSTPYPVRATDIESEVLTGLLLAAPAAAARRRRGGRIRDRIGDRIRDRIGDRPFIRSPFERQPCR